MNVELIVNVLGEPLRLFLRKGATISGTRFLTTNGITSNTLVKHFWSKRKSELVYYVSI